MDLFGVILFIIWIVFIPWAWFAVEKTYKERLKMIPVPGDPNFWNEIGKFNSVSFNKHLWYRITFRNPNSLYNQIDDKGE